MIKPNVLRNYFSLLPKGKTITTNDIRSYLKRHGAYNPRSLSGIVTALVNAGHLKNLGKAVVSSEQRHRSSYVSSYRVANRN